jgi:hypothetical protein
MADTITELHTFAEKCGLKKEWFQDHKKHPHYDVWGGRNERTVYRLGAELVDSRFLVNLKVKEPFPTGDRDFYPCKNEIFVQTYDKI